MKKITHRKDLKVLSSCSAILFVMIIGVVYISQVSFAALSPEKMILDKTPTNIQAKDEAQNIEVRESEVKDTEARNNEIANEELDQVLQLDLSEPIPVKEDGNIPVEEGLDGIDLSNDPDYIASLKRIYSDEDLEMLRAAGVVARVVYGDYGSEEGYCFKQDVSPGQDWNSAASIFIWAQKGEDKLEPLIEEEEIISNIENNSSNTEQTDSNSNPLEMIESSELNTSQDERIDSQIQESKDMTEPLIEEKEIISNMDNNSSNAVETDSISNPSEIIESNDLNISQDEGIDSQQVNTNGNIAFIK